MPEEGGGEGGKKMDKARSEKTVHSQQLHIRLQILKILNGEYAALLREKTSMDEEEIAVRGNGALSDYKSQLEDLAIFPPNTKLTIAEEIIRRASRKR